jgi:cell division septum initiation protein DivIVA
MILRITLSTLFFFSISFCATKPNEVDKLLEKVNHAKTVEKKKALIEELKQKLAQKNKKAQEEADAIIKAKQKIPQKIYDDSLLNGQK